MDHKIVWSPKAVSNLEQISAYIAQDSPYYASLFARRILSIVESIPSFPRVGRIVPEYGSSNIRERLYKSYRIVYRIKPNVIEIAAIVRSARLLRNA